MTVIVGGHKEAFAQEAVPPPATGADSGIAPLPRTSPLKGERPGQEGRGLGFGHVSPSLSTGSADHFKGSAGKYPRAHGAAPSPSSRVALPHGPPPRRLDSCKDGRGGLLHGQLWSRGVECEPRGEGYPGAGSHPKRESDPTHLGQPRPGRVRPGSEGGGSAPTPSFATSTCGAYTGLGNEGKQPPGNAQWSWDLSERSLGKLGSDGGGFLKR